jgi:hypothetical protein
MWQARQMTHGALKATLSWSAVAFRQFALFFPINALVFTATEGTPRGFLPAGLGDLNGGAADAVVADLHSCAD